jgi:hypothetical protein
MALSYKDDEKVEADARLDPYDDKARHLYQQEQSAYDREFEGITSNANETASSAQEDANIAKTKNIDSTKEKEQTTGSWKTDVSGGDSKGGGKKEPTTFLTQVKKKGPIGLIIGLLGGGGILGGGLLGPAGALIHFKEVLVNKLDTMSSVMQQRSDLIMKDRMFSTNATCAIKVRCRFSGLTDRQVSRLRIQGAEILDANGKPLTKNILGRYTGGKTLVLEDGTHVLAKDYLKTLGTNPAARDLSRSVFAPRFWSWNDSVSKDIRAKKKLVTNPEWGNGDEKTARQDVFKAVSGDAYTATVQDPAATQQYETNPDGSIKKDANGNPIPKPNTATIDFGDSTGNINAASDALAQQAAAGDIIPQIPVDPGGAAAMAETAVSSPSGLKKALGFLNPADFLVGLCATYKLTNSIVIAAKTIALANAMRYASQFLSTADKIKAGDATSTDAEQAMTILERADPYGDAFGDSTGYQYAEYGTVPDKSVASSALGNGVVQVFSSVIRWVNDTLGKTTVRDGCAILSNPFVQGVLALTSFIPGGGQLARGITTVLSVGAKAVAEQTIKDLVASIAKAAIKKISESVTKDAVKQAAKAATRQFIKMAATAGGIFLAGYLTERYAIPYLARVISGAMLTGSEDGVTSADTIANGFDATNQVTAQERGLVPLSTSQASAFNEFNNASTSTYVADMQAKSNPFNVMDPYSASNSLASTFYTFASKLKNTSLLSMPATILSAFNTQNLFGNSTAMAATTNSSNCDDSFLNSTGLAVSPFCNVVMGFNDANMLQNTDPDTGVTQWMLDNKQIDTNGDPITGSDFDDFMSKCITDSGNKQITDVGDSSIQLDPECYDINKNNTTEYKMFHLYVIDGGGIDAMDAPDA